MNYTFTLRWAQGERIPFRHSLSGAPGLVAVVESNVGQSGVLRAFRTQDAAHQTQSFDCDGMPGLVRGIEQEFRCPTSFRGGRTISQPGDGEVRAELAGVGLDVDVFEGGLYVAVRFPEGHDIAIKTDPDYPGIPAVGIGPDTAKPKGKGLNSFSCQCESSDYRINPVGTYVAKELHREVDVFRSDGLQAIDSGSAQALGEFAQDRLHVVRKFYGQESADVVCHVR